jgi:flagellar P-ring protein precursor FlgI
MIDGASITIRAAGSGDERMRLISQIENLGVQRTEPPAKVIVNARTGTVVINSAVRVSPAAVTHGKLTVRIDESQQIVQPAPFSQGQTALENKYNVSVEEEKKPMFLLNPGPKLADVVKAVNAIGASPADLVAILEALKEAGALRAELIVL